jgi:hypothetical protein
MRRQLFLKACQWPDRQGVLLLSKQLRLTQPGTGRPPTDVEDELLALPWVVSPSACFGSANSTSKANSTRRFRLSRATIGLMLLALGAAAERGFCQGGYRFFLNGEEMKPSVVSLRGTPEELAAGDAIEIDGLLVPLGPAAEYRFHSKGVPGGTLLYREGEGSKRIIGLHIDYGRIAAEANEEAKNGFLGFEGEFDDSLAIYLDGWGLEAPDWLRSIARRAISLNLSPGRSMQFLDALSVIGPNVTCLRIEYPYAYEYEKVDEHFKDALSKLRCLRVLDVHSTVPKFDVQLLANASDLRHLTVGLLDGRLENSEEIGRFQELRWLNLRTCRGIPDVRFLTGLLHLRCLNVSETDVTDLTPIRYMPELREVYANMSSLTCIPVAPLANLRFVEVFSTPLNERLWEQFKELNPNCVVITRVDAAFKKAVDGATSVQIWVKRGAYFFDKMVTEEKDTRAVAEVLDALEFDETAGDVRCSCTGDVLLKFCDRNRVTATLVFYHAHHVRWQQWRNWVLTEKSAKALCEWLAKRGVEYPLRQFLGREKEKSQTEPDKGR